MVLSIRFKLNFNLYTFSFLLIRVTQLYLKIKYKDWGKFRNDLLQGSVLSSLLFKFKTSFRIKKTHPVRFKVKLHS